jgi:hypothetical protein
MPPKVEPEPATDEKAWHLDRRVPVALILAVLGQGAVGIWWMAGLSSRVAHLETSVPALAASDAETSRDVRAIGLQIARLEERVAAQIQAQTLQLQAIAARGSPDAGRNPRPAAGSRLPGDRDPDADRAGCRGAGVSGAGCGAD